MNKRALLVFALVHAIVAVNSLQCYQCSNCATVSSEKLVECDASSTTTTARPSTNGTNTNPSTNETVTISSTNETNTKPSTNESITNPSANETDTNTSGNETLPNPSTNETLPNPSINETLPKPSINETNTIPSNNTSQSKEIRNSQFGRSKREIPLENDGFYDFPNHITKATVDYYCYKVHVKINGTDVVERGCAKKTNETSCDNVPENITSCKLCDTDKCNGAFIIQLPFFTMIIMLILSFVI